MERRNGVRRASEAMSRETEKSKEGVTRYWKEALTAIIALGLAIGVMSDKKEDPIPLEKLGAELLPGGEEEDKAKQKEQLNQAEHAARLLAEKLAELKRRQEDKDVQKEKELERFREEIFQDLSDKLEEVVDKAQDPKNFNMGMEQKAMYETLNIVKQNNGRIAVELDDQPVMEVVVSTYDDYKQYLEDQLSAAELLQLSEEEKAATIRMLQHKIDLSRARDARSKYNDLPGDAPFYYINHMGDDRVYQDEFEAGVPSDSYDRNSLSRSVWSNVSLYTYHTR